MKRLLIVGIILFSLWGIFYGIQHKRKDSSHITEMVLPKDSIPHNKVNIPLRKDSLVYVRYCDASDISRQYNFNVCSQRYETGNGYSDSCIIQILIRDKHSGSVVDSLCFISHFLFDTVFTNCLQCHSRYNGRNNGEIIEDGNYGDLIVSDFNFDGKDDIAVVHDSGGNSGPTYDFFLQDSGRKFIRNTFLSDSMEFFPDRIDKQHKILKTSVIISYCDISEMRYLYSPVTKNWKRISHDIIHMGKSKRENG